MAAFNSKEYTRIRDIVQKRMKRAVSAGLMAPVHFPTVKEIKSGIVDPGQAMRALQGFYSGGSQVKTIRQTGLVPEFRQFPELPKQRKLTTEEQKQRRREQQRKYRRIQKVKKAAQTKEKRSKYVHYLYALEGLNKIWKKAGHDLGIDLNSLSPAETVAFVEYLEYRFSQGDFTQDYIIDEFVKDFSTLVRKKKYSPDAIIKDFDKFLEDRKQLDKNALTMEGITNDEVMKYWDEFIGK